MTPPPTGTPTGTPTIAPTGTPTAMPTPSPTPQPTMNPDFNPACENDGLGGGDDNGIYCENNCGPLAIANVLCAPIIADISFCLCVITNIQPILAECPTFADLTLADLGAIVSQEVIDFCCALAEGACDNL